MKNSDLIAFFKPIISRFSSRDAVELIDVTGYAAQVLGSSHRLVIRLTLSRGLYRGRLATVRGSFDMSSAMIDMVRVPDGKRVPVGPWDLDHLRNVMAMPMARTYVNGELMGGLWFSMPGPAEIAEERLTAEFGFEAQGGENEIVLELIERDRERMDWTKLEFLELRKDDRRPVQLEPATTSRPRIFLTSGEAPQVRKRWEGKPEFADLRRQLLTEDLVYLSDSSQGTLELACLFYAITGDPAVGARARQRVLELANASTWSGRPDPLLMGGDNDRAISLRLYLTALGWEYLQPLLDDGERGAMLAKADEYIGKIYRFTLLQRGYMGCPAIDPHSLGAWNGAAIACMAFFDELAIARKALPLFHGLFCESLTLFPDSGKAAWATYFPFHMVLYLAAAHTFGGMREEVDKSAFLDHLGEALMASFEVPNSQELQRGLRTREHRFLVAFLCRFHPSPGIDSIYRAFAEKERRATGRVSLGIFDLLYAPDDEGEVAAFPDRPLFAKDVGDLIASVRGEHTMAVSISGGPKAGRKAMFRLMPQNREFAPSMGALEISVDGSPVICNINMGQYGLDSALTNTMCFEDGGAVTNGQYLNGAVSPESCGVIRRCFIDQRYIYAHIVVTYALDPGLRVTQADRVFVLDRRTGIVVLSDAFSGERPILFATHLHCSGSITDLGGMQYRLTGGQANLIAGTKGGSKELDDAERGELFVQVLHAPATARVITEEPTWVPGYIYGLNNTGKEEISDGRFPRYRRWRLETDQPVKECSFLFTLGGRNGETKYTDGAVLLPQAGSVRLGSGTMSALDVECGCECLMVDGETRRIVAIGLQWMRHGEAELNVSSPVDVTYDVSTGIGTIYGVEGIEVQSDGGFRIYRAVPIGEDNGRTLSTNRTTFARAKVDAADMRRGA